MKNTHKYLSAIALNGALCLLLALPAAAQRTGSSGGSSSSSSSGGGSHSSSSGSSGGGSSSSSSRGSSGSSSSGSYRPSTGSTNSYRPSVNAGGSYGGAYRPSVGTQRVAVAPPRVFSQGIRPPVNRIGLGNVGTTATTGNRGYVAPGTGNVVGTRGYVGQGGRSSVGAGGRGYYPTGYFGTHHYYYYHHDYYNTYYAPRLGFGIGFLPYGYYPFYWNDLEFYYSDGLFYNYDNGEYTVVEPPIGAEIDKLPSNAQSIVINGQQYYEADGVYYEPITKDDGTTVYQVAGKDGELNTNQQGADQQAPQVGDVVTTLPDGCRKININGEKFYVSPDGYYYQEAKDQNGGKVYKIVGTPEDQEQQNQ